MFSWITGPRITNAIEDLQPESNYESTFIDQPETPAHQFPIKAFKHAIFGTPAPNEASNNVKTAERKAKLDAANSKTIALPAPKDEAPLSSPSKQSGGILMTPGTTNKGRKTVSFGSHVVDNEGKRNNAGKSGIPNDCPGKFPSPFTPGTQLRPDPTSDTRPRTKLTEALLDARTTKQPKSGQKPKARDDSDITMDLGAPRSESGKYWKEQYESYAERSEKEMKKVISKQQLAKKFAMKKDGEVTELATKLEQERKRFRQRERDLEQQNKDLQERLRLALSESMSSSVEVAALKARVATLERSISMPSSELQQTKASFNIYEDLSKDALHQQLAEEKVAEVSYAPSMSMASSGKENSSPKPRHVRRQTLPDMSNRLGAPPRLGVAEGEASILLGKSPKGPTRLSEYDQAQEQPEPSLKSPLKIRRNLIPGNPVPRSPTAVVPSSPLPMPSPDPWMDMNEMSIQEMDKMAMPISMGRPYSNPAWNPPPKHQRGSKSISHTKESVSQKTQRQAEKSLASGQTIGMSKTQTDMDKKAPVAKINTKPDPKASKADVSEMKATVGHASTDPKFDVGKAASHHAEGSAQVKQDRVEPNAVDRKEQARRRLEERKRLKKNSPA
ncbi:hypothetical protein IQ07DRAFT_508632 [Pyrenochaeta sp. DS3sAY3a]|nr:hypothetical protein IQ07DRAFT_508632 [Pyrenochaeta sp. DS3sAY3a]